MIVDSGGATITMISSSLSLKWPRPSYSGEMLLPRDLPSRSISLPPWQHYCPRLS